MKFDLTIKTLFASLPQTLFRHLWGQEVIELGAVEISVPMMLRPDLFGRMTNGQPVHMELQSTGDREMGWRMLGYRWVFWQSLGLEDVAQIVFALRGKTALSDELNRLGLQFRFQVVSFEEIDAAVLGGSDRPEELVLSFLCRGGTDPAHIKRILRCCVESPADQREILIGHLQVLSGLRPGSELTIKEELTKMPVTIDLYENPLLRPWFDRAHEQGVEKGEEGREEGREGQQQMLRALLAQKFEIVTPEMESRIRAGSMAELTRWGTRVLAANSVAEVFG